MSPVNGKDGGSRGQMGSARELGIRADNPERNVAYVDVPDIKKRYVAGLALSHVHFDYLCSYVSIAVDTVYARSRQG